MAPPCDDARTPSSHPDASLLTVLFLPSGRVPSAPWLDPGRHITASLVFFCFFPSFSAVFARAHSRPLLSALLALFFCFLFFSPFRCGLLVAREAAKPRSPRQPTRRPLCTPPFCFNRPGSGPFPPPARFPARRCAGLPPSSAHLCSVASPGTRRHPPPRAAPILRLRLRPSSLPSLPRALSSQASPRAPRITSLVFPPRARPSLFLAPITVRSSLFVSPSPFPSSSFPFSLSFFLSFFYHGRSVDIKTQPEPGRATDAVPLPSPCPRPFPRAPPAAALRPLPLCASRRSFDTCARRALFSDRSSMGGGEREVSPGRERRFGRRKRRGLPGAAAD